MPSVRQANTPLSQNYLAEWLEMTKTIKELGTGKDGKHYIIYNDNSVEEMTKNNEISVIEWLNKNTDLF